ncbi:MAG: YeeE/YedE family protein [Pseudomonadales bacterium]|jgi:uncharacterized membrane protein YedE/YeeE|tara:strand:+ start:352 stop:750 length:399 start_codon:yes stop_codon:yes gene_type:complete
MIEMSIFGGLLIGLASVCLMLFQGRIAGISSIVYRAIFHLKFESWALTFVIGLVLGPLLVAAFNGPAAPVIDLAWWQVLLGGVLVGVGSRLGSGCTSGHGVCGIARGSTRSIVATLTFMATGVITVFLMGMI